MAKFNWTYVSDTGRQYQVGLFHGLRTGHLMIYCNAKVLMVDFKVFQTERYPFFIEDELVEVQVKRQADHFEYHFLIDQEVDTPRNRIRKKEKQKYFRQTLTFFGSLALAVIIFAAFAIRYDGRRETDRYQAMIRHSSYQTTGKVLARAADKRFTTITYEFTATERPIKGSIDLPNDSLPKLFPIHPGDEFAVLYVWYQPGINRIELKYPSEDQIRRYFDQTVALHQRLHPELTNQQTTCLVDLALELDGLPGLAKFFHQERSPLENPQYNQDSYLRLIRDRPFDQKRRERCW